MSELLDSLSAERIFSLFIIDLEQVKEHGDSPYLLKIVLPRYAKFLGILNIPSPLAGLGLPVGGGRDAYAFLCDPNEVETSNFYVTPLKHDMAFPWERPGDLLKSMLVRCTALAMTAPGGVPVLHVQTSVNRDKYEQFEQEVRDAGYLLLNGIPYTQAQSFMASMFAPPLKA
jgi:hypothetical protein